MQANVVEFQQYREELAASMIGYENARSIIDDLDLPETSTNDSSPRKVKGPEIISCYTEDEDLRNGDGLCTIL